MRIISTVKELKEIRSSINRAEKKIGFVPTMGGLHDGHLSLIKKCISENDVTFVSVFLNPTQFNDKNDLLTYPADRDADIAFLEKAGVDYAFMPDYSEMYPDDYKYKLEETDFSKMLCGAKRPGHFDGVLTVVMKLFNLVRPQFAYFGEKDYQQYQLLKGMVEAFFLDITLVPCPIIREESGLAMSSRNNRLSAEARNNAPKFHEILVKEITVLQKKTELENAGFSVDYLVARKGRLYGAVFTEGVRLIDNVPFSGADECLS